MSRGPNLPPPIAEAVRIAAEEAKLSPYALLQKTNALKIVHARRKVFTDLHNQGFSSGWIAKWFDMDHTTVLYHIKRNGAQVSKRAPVQLQHRTGPRHYIRPKEISELHCDRCGYRSAKAAEFREEGYHHVCVDHERCQFLQGEYREFCGWLIARLESQVH